MITRACKFFRVELIEDFDDVRIELDSAQPVNLVDCSNSASWRTSELLPDRISGAEGGVLVHRLELLGAEAAGLKQDRVRDSELADVVKRRRLPHQDDVTLGKTEQVGQRGCGASDPFRVLERIVISVLGCARERSGGAGLRNLPSRIGGRATLRGLATPRADGRRRRSAWPVVFCWKCDRGRPGSRGSTALSVRVPYG